MRTNLRGPTRRSWPSLLFVVPFVLALAGCYRNVPVNVHYPDDPRVVNGQWDLKVLSRATAIRQILYVAGSQRLFMRINDALRLWEFDAVAGWQEVEYDLATSVNLATYDPVLEAFVAVRAEAGSLRVTTVPADGSSSTVVTVDLPEGHTLEATARGSGNTFAYTRDAARLPHLTWWNTLTGARGGSRVVPAAPDGFGASRNGRLLVIFNLNLWRATVIDTAAPQVNKTVRLGACRSNAPIQSSLDGRWALFKGCNDVWQIADLTDADPGLTPIGASRTEVIGFSYGGNDVVWLDRDGAVYSFDPQTRTRTELLRLDDDLNPNSSIDYLQLHVNETAGLLAVTTHRGAVRVEPLPGSAPAPAMSAELPRMELGGATLDVVAAELTVDAYEYTFAGTVRLSGSGAPAEELAIEGRVYANMFHQYRPGIQPAVYMARLLGSATLKDPLSEDELYELTFETTERTDTVYEGRLIDNVSGQWYTVRLKKADVTAP